MAILTKPRRFRSLQWQLTAAFTLVSFFIVLILGMVLGIGFPFFETVFGIRGRQIETQLNTAVGLASRSELPNQTPDDIISKVFDSINVHCEFESSRGAAYYLTDFATEDALNESCPANRTFSLGLQTAVSHYRVYQNLKRVTLWQPDHETIIIDRNGWHTSAQPLSSAEQTMIENGMQGQSSHSINGTRTII